MAIENVVLARRWFEEVWNQRRTDTIDELLTDESVSHTASGPLRGKQEFKERAHAVFLSAFPDLRPPARGADRRGGGGGGRAVVRPCRSRPAPTGGWPWRGRSAGGTRWSPAGPSRRPTAAT